MRNRRRSTGRASPDPGEGTPMTGPERDMPAHDMGGREMPEHDMPARGMHAGQRGPAASAAGRGTEEAEEFALWENRTRIALTPIAAPSILGLFGFAGATMMVGAWQANWYGSALTPLVIFPFALTFGGLAQFLAGMWSYKARDGVATAMHGMWGAFWLGWGLLFLLVAVGAYPLALVPRIGGVSQGFAFWFIALCVITGFGALAAMGKNLALAAVLWPLAAGAGFTAAGFWAGSTWPIRVGGWLFVVSAAIAVYTAAAMMLENSYGRTILPLFALRKHRNIPGHRASRPLEFQHGEPGVKIGQ